MSPHEAESRTSTPNRDARRYFTVEQADETLVLVSQIARDLVHEYQEMMLLRSQREERAFSSDPGREDVDELNLTIEEKARRIQSLLDELEDVGCQAKDLVTGLVDFPALYQGREVWLCWRLGEDRVGWWHETQAGFAGRKAVDDDFRRGLSDSVTLRQNPYKVG